MTSSRTLTSRDTEDRVLAVNTQVTSVAELVSPLSSGLQGTAVKIAQYSTNVRFEDLPELVKVLQEVAAVHPFIACEFVQHLQVTLLAAHSIGHPY